MGKSFEEYQREDQRLVLLRVLLGVTQYMANSTVLATATYNLGHALSRDQVKTHLRWLAEQGLLVITEPVEGLLVATLTERGRDVGRGRAIVHGVTQPGL